MSDDRRVIARPYARALFEFAVETKQISFWSNVVQVMALIVSDSSVTALISNPCVDNGKIGALLLGICEEKLAFSADEKVFAKNFVNLLLAYNRLVLLPQISELFAVYYAEHERVIKASVTSALALDAPQQERLFLALEKRFKCKMELDYSVDPSLLGGVIIRMGDVVIDGSARGKLSRLMSHLNLKETLCQ